MFSIYSIKSNFQYFLKPIANFSVKAKVTPNQITCFTLLFSCCFGLYFMFHKEYLAWVGVVFFLRMALNALDGMVAKLSNKASSLGCYLNELGDIVSDAVLYLPFAFIHFSHFYLIFLIIFLSSLSETTGILGSTVGSQRRYDGPMGKSDRAFAFSMIALGLYFGVNYKVIAIAYYLMSGLIVLSIFFRIRGALKLFKRK